MTSKKRGEKTPSEAMFQGGLVPWKGQVLIPVERRGRKAYSRLREWGKSLLDISNHWKQWLLPVHASRPAGERKDCLVTMNEELLKSNRQTWFVMLCHDTRQLESRIDEYNGSGIPDADRITDIFVPSKVIRRRKAGRYAGEPSDDGNDRGEDREQASNSIREEMSEFVFLLARPSALRLLRRQYWNTGRCRLRHYYDKNGEEIFVREKRMQTFITACLEYREKFELRPDSSSLREGVVVTIRRGPLKNLPATIYNIRYKAGGIRFSMSVRFFGNGQDIKIHDRTPDDVLAPRDSIVFSDDFIGHIESRLLLMLSRRVNRKETGESRLRDRRQLDELRYFQYVTVDDTALSMRLDALMSVRASLSGDRGNKSKYNAIVRRHIGELRPLMDDASPSACASLAYQLAALCISTGDPAYRGELKPLVRQHLQDHAPLRRFLSLIARMQMRKA